MVVLRGMCGWSSEFFERWCRWVREDCGWILSNAPRRARARRTHNSRHMKLAYLESERV